MKHKCKICGMEYNPFMAFFKMHEIGKADSSGNREIICRVCNDCINEYGYEIYSKPAPESVEIQKWREESDLECHEIINHSNHANLPKEFIIIGFAVTTIICIPDSLEILKIILRAIMICITLILLKKSIKQILKRNKHQENWD